MICSTSTGYIEDGLFSYSGYFVFVPVSQMFCTQNSRGGKKLERNIRNVRKYHLWQIFHKSFLFTKVALHIPSRNVRPKESTTSQDMELFVQVKLEVHSQVLPSRCGWMKCFIMNTIIINRNDLSKICIWIWIKNETTAWRSRFF